MRRNVLTVGLAVACLSLFVGADWPQFRGQGHRSIAGSDSLPTSWSAENHVAWKKDIPGRAASSPIVVGGQVIVTSASGNRQDRLHVVSFDATSGEKKWHRQFWATGRTLCHPFSSVAAPSPVSDGKKIYAFFSSNDLICLDLAGNILWMRGLTHDFPTAANDTGMSASPVIIGDTLIVQVENEGDSFAAGIDTENGTQRWKIKRPKFQNWTSPTVMQTEAGQYAVLLQSPTQLTAHDPQTGKQLWKYEGDCNTIVSPLAIDGTIYVHTAGGIAAMVRSGSTDEVDVLWSQPKLSSGAASPLVYQDRVYSLKRSGILACADSADGKILWQLRLGGTFWATPVAAGNYLYCVNVDGLTHVVELGEKGKSISKNEISDKVLGSPAVVDGAIFLRGERSLWKIAG